MTRATLAIGIAQRRLRGTFKLTTSPRVSPLYQDKTQGAAKVWDGSACVIRRVGGDRGPDKDEQGLQDELPAVRVHDDEVRLNP